MMTGVGFTNLGSRNPIEIGKSAYERSFGVKFFEEHEISEDGIYDYNTRVLPSNLSCGLRTDLEGQRIAVVGNGRVDASGAEIDAHDQVIRITGMRHWRRDPDGDGVRTTLWAGLPAHVVARDEAGAVHANGAFASLVRDGVAFWAVSPFHVTCVPIFG
ncbi:hypothetical protein M446_0830 [Methylobacterium sp. 4-46]|uniref:hypothetical protein n=1 Tax=unclassified Methylobacterium TaxID=2615210 RepID=UPI000165C8D5|nr:MULTISPECIES: hypothetical protein [Methylobacterium]ACA15384.1 hypothetical protein M446_0830 [Methylobacterium sp. 4-46]WFT81105.1 hypothetical protein QA634_04160 [Methylobacterium nodulans]